MLAFETNPRTTTVHLPGMPELHPASHHFWLWQKRQEALKGWAVTWDSFDTPPAIVAAALNQVRLAPGAAILDAGTGAGAWIDAAAVRWPDSIRSAGDIQDVPRPAGVNGSWWPERDFLLMGAPPAGFDLVVMNPPFKLAEQFIDHAWGLLSPRGILVAFTRLALLAGQDRGRSFWPGHEPARVCVLPERPSFTGGGTDTKTEYCVLIFQRSYFGPTTLERLWWKGTPVLPAVQP